MKRLVALGAAVAAALVLVIPTAGAEHTYPWADGSGVRVGMFPGFEGPDQLGSDEAFHVVHGWSWRDGDEIPEDKKLKDFVFTLQVITGDDVDDPFATGTFLEPVFIGCDPSRPDFVFCKSSLYDFPEGLAGVIDEYDDEPVRLVGTWLQLCGWVNDCNLDEDQVVVSLRNELIINPTE